MRGTERVEGASMLPRTLCTQATAATPHARGALHVDSAQTTFFFKHGRTGAHRQGIRAHIQRSAAMAWLRKRPPNLLRTGNNARVPHRRF